MAKKKTTNSLQVSPKNYIQAAARKVPIKVCYVNEDWRDSGMASVAIIREKQSGKYILGLYMLDVFCLGVKNTSYWHNSDDEELEEIIEKVYSRQGRNIEISADFAQNLVYGALEYAEDLGFQPHKDFKVSEYILDPVDSVEYIDIEFGQNGKPFYFSGPFDNAGLIINQLKKAVGEGNFNYMLFDGNNDFGD